MEDAVERILDRRRRQHLGRLRGGGLAGAVLLHVALAAAAFVVPRLGAEEREPMEFVSVRIVPAQALGTPQPPAPRPEPAPLKPEPEAEEQEPEPEPEEEEAELPAPEPEAPEPEPKRSEPARPQPPAQQPSRSEPAPPSQGTPGSRQGASTGSPTGTAARGAQVAVIGDPDFTYGYYLDRVLAAIEAQWRRPPTDGAVVEVALDFRIRRDGTVAELDVAESSGFNAFDLAGLRAVQAASPLPPLPAGYRQDSLAIRLLIR